MLEAGGLDGAGGADVEELALTGVDAVAVTRGLAVSDGWAELGWQVGVPVALAVCLLPVALELCLRRSRRAVLAGGGGGVALVVPVAVVGSRPVAVPSR